MRRYTQAAAQLWGRTLFTMRGWSPQLEAALRQAVRRWCHGITPACHSSGQAAARVACGLPGGAVEWQEQAACQQASADNAPGPSAAGCCSSTSGEGVGVEQASPGGSSASRARAWHRVAGSALRGAPSAGAALHDDRPHHRSARLHAWGHLQQRALHSSAAATAATAAASAQASTGRGAPAGRPALGRHRGPQGRRTRGDAPEASGPKVSTSAPWPWVDESRPFVLPVWVGVGRTPVLPLPLAISSVKV